MKAEPLKDKFYTIGYLPTKERPAKDWELVFRVKDVASAVQWLKEQISKEAIERKLPITASSLDRLPVNYIIKLIDQAFADCVEVEND